MSGARGRIADPAGPAPGLLASRSCSRLSVCALLQVEACRAEPRVSEEEEEEVMVTCGLM